MVSEMTGKYPQDSYSTVVCLIQSEWFYCAGYALALVVNFLWETFLLRLFFIKSKSLPPIIGNLSTIPINRYGLSLQIPVTSVDEKFQSSQRASKELISVIMGER